MSPYTAQLIILAGAYVLALCCIIAAGTISGLSWRSSRRLEVRSSVAIRLTTLEKEFKLQTELVDRFTKRQTKVRADQRRAAASEDGETETEGPIDRDQLVVEFDRAKGA